MLTLRAAAQRALEALEVIDKEFRRHGRQHWPEAVKARVASPALRAALAEPQIDPVDEYRKGFIAGQIDMRDREQAEPVQEPFGYLWPTGRHPEFRFTQQRRDGVDGMPLYIAPPQRKPLTDEEIDALAMDEDGLPNSHIEFARAIERAHGIGGGND